MNIYTLLINLQMKPYNLNQAQALDLLAFLLNYDRDQLWNCLSDNYWGDSLLLENTLKLLANHYPLPYILQEKYFLGSKFYVDQRVLIPRDETENLVSYACQWLKQQDNAKIIDLGTGSGVIGLSLKKRFPECPVWLSDNSWEALQVAQKNAQIQNLDVCFLLGNFLKPAQSLKMKFNLIIANPPYISEKEMLDPSLSFEPEQALFAPNEGLYFYQQLFSNWQTLIDPSKPAAIMVEFGYHQKPQIEKILQDTNILNFFKPNFYRDWNHHWRYLILETRSHVKCLAN